MNISTTLFVFSQKLKVHIDKYYEPNPYDEVDEEDEWNQFNIEQQCDFWRAVRDVLW